MPIVQNTAVPSKPRTSAKQRTTPPFLSFPRGRRRRTYRPTDKPTNGRTTSANSSKYLSHFTAYRPNQKQAQTNEHLPRLYRSHAAAADGTIYRRIDIPMYVRVDGKCRQIKAPIFYRTLYCSNQICVQNNTQLLRLHRSHATAADGHTDGRESRRTDDGRATSVNRSKYQSHRTPQHPHQKHWQRNAQLRRLRRSHAAAADGTTYRRTGKPTLGRKAKCQQINTNLLPHTVPSKPRTSAKLRTAFSPSSLPRSFRHRLGQVPGTKTATPPWFGAFRCRQGHPLGHKTQP